jgi:cytochrome b561
MSHPVRYTRTAIYLHWLMALAIVGTFGVGLYMHDLPLSPGKLKIYSWHKWAGVTIFLLVMLRLVWQLTHRPPEPHAGMPAWQQTAASLVHFLLYVLMIAVPLSGWLMSSANGFQTVWFGVLPLPDLLENNKELGETLEGLHRAFNFTLAGLVLIHAGAAIRHHFVEGDDVLGRMLPFFRKS